MEGWQTMFDETEFTAEPGEDLSLFVILSAGIALFSIVIGVVLFT